jgi:hypothetical protein
VASCQLDADSPVKAICPISNPVRDTVTIFVTLEGALAATLTVSVMSGKPHPLLESRQTHWYSAHLTTLC